LRELGTLLNAFSIEYPSDDNLSKSLESTGEKVDRESTILEKKVFEVVEGQVDRIHEASQTCEAMRRTLCNLIGQIIELQNVSQRLHLKRAELLQKESEENETNVIESLKIEISKVKKIFMVVARRRARSKAKRCRRAKIDLFR
jgi:hypothetical protein